MALVDKATGLLYVVKRPIPESRNYAVDFKKLLISTGVLSSVLNTTILAQGLTAVTNPLILSSVQVNGTQVRFIVSGGTPNEDYEIQIEVVDSAGNTLVESILIKVRYANILR